jgi:uncharacterized protein
MEENKNSKTTPDNPRKEKDPDNFDFQQAGPEQQEQKEEKLWRADTSTESRQNAGNKQQQDQNYLTKEDLPDASNESTGKMGSGQRQDSN